MSALFVALLALSCPNEEPIRVTVVAVLATANNNMVDPKLAALAGEVQKRDPKLTGFRIANTEGKSIPVGDSHTFELVDNQELTVRVEKSRDVNSRIRLTIKPPGIEKITYGCVCDKFFPIVTPHRTKAGDVLIVVIMAKPCTAGMKPGWFPWHS
jgi:hypothetical protein